MRINLRSKKVVAAAVAATVLTGGGAYAYWTAGGTGSGTAATADGLTPLTAVQTADITELAPGSGPQTLNGTFLNENSTPVYVATLNVEITNVVKDVSAVGLCTIADYTLGDPAVAAVATDVMTVGAEALADDTSTWSGAEISMMNTDENQDGCKGATVELTYTVV